MSDQLLDVEKLTITNDHKNHETTEGCAGTNTTTSNNEEICNLYKQECNFCCINYPVNEIVVMLYCQHGLCFKCAQTYFTNQILNKNLKGLNCSICEKPSLPSMDESNLWEYLNNLSLQLQQFIDSDMSNELEGLIRNATIHDFNATSSSLHKTKVKQLVDENLVKTIAEAECVINLMEMNYSQCDAILAAKLTSNLSDAIDIINQNCGICEENVPAQNIIGMLNCTHTLCKDCTIQYFTNQIKSNTIFDLVCPYCSTPNLKELDENEFTEYFSYLDIILKTNLETEVHALFQRKLRDYTLNSLNWKWCQNCPNGYFIVPLQDKMQCTVCDFVICTKCDKPWEPQHENISCEKFNDWKLANNPKNLIKGVQLHLKNHGIVCPKCKFQFSLSRGGCIHYKCTQCKYEFCYGCQQQFILPRFMGDHIVCNNDYCKNFGLHAHHPRNCLYYLRERHPKNLEELLKSNNVVFEIKKSQLNSSEICQIPEQKFDGKKDIDDVCGNDAYASNLGLCRDHYIEYLTGLIITNKIDPVEIMSLIECQCEIKKIRFKLPPKEITDTDEIYLNTLKTFIKNNIPITDATCINLLTN